MFSGNDVNNAALYRRGNRQIGDVVIDVNAGMALEILSALEGTLRCRVPY